jgi:hypothetical protein
MSDKSQTRLQLFKATIGGEGRPQYVGLVEVPKAGFYWIEGYVDETTAGEKFIRGELSTYSGPRRDLSAPAERPLGPGEMVTQPGFWPVAAKRKR